MYSWWVHLSSVASPQTGAVLEESWEKRICPSPGLVTAKPWACRLISSGASGSIRGTGSWKSWFFIVHEPEDIGRYPKWFNWNSKVSSLVSPCLVSRFPRGTAPALSLFLLILLETATNSMWGPQSQLLWGYTPGGNVSWILNSWAVLPAVGWRVLGYLCHSVASTPCLR